MAAPAWYLFHLRFIQRRALQHSARMGVSCRPFRHKDEHAKAGRTCAWEQRATHLGNSLRGLSAHVEVLMSAAKYAQMGGCYISLPMVYELVAVKLDWAGHQSPSIPKFPSERRMVSMYAGFRPIWKCT